MSEDYAALAPIYDAVGMSTFSEIMTPRYIDYAQRHDWLGRRIFDFGCGTGTATYWLGSRSYSVLAIDRSPEMLDVARQKADDTHSLSINWEHADIRKIDNDYGQADMIISVNVLNEVESIRDLQVIFQNAVNMLKPDKLFIFDMYTIEGLIRLAEPSDVLVHNSDDLSLVISTTFDFDRQSLSTGYLAFHAQDNGWQRIITQNTRRAFPLQAIATLLAKCGFSDVTVLNLDMIPVTSNLAGLHRVVFVAKK